MLELASLFAIVLATSLRSLTTEDLSLHDEASYLALGLAAAKGDLPSFVDGATYIDMYALLSRVASDPVGLYFAGRVFAAVSIVLAVWLATRIMARPVFAWLAATVMAMTAVPYTWPGVATPAAAAALVALALMWRFPSAVTAAVASCLVWLAAGARPEYVFAAILVTVGALLLVVPKVSAWLELNAPSRSAAIGSAALALMMPITLVALHGWPFDSRGRQWDAFQQHFALRVAQPGQDPWYEADTILSQYFGESMGLREALFTNPIAFLSHVVANLFEIPRAVLGLLAPRDNVLVGWLGLGSLATLLLCWGFALSLVTVQARRNFASLLRQSWSRRKLPTLVMALAIVGSAIASAIVIYPRAHYLLVVAAGVVVVLAAVQSALNSNRVQGLVPLAATLLVFSIFGARIVETTAGRMSEPAPVAASLANMNRDSRHWKLLGIEWGLEPFARDMERIATSEPHPDETFPQLLDRLGINAILVNGRLSAGDWALTSGFDEFLADPLAFGFQPAAPNSPIWVRHASQDVAVGSFGGS